VEAVAPSVSVEVALAGWDITSADIMNRLVKAARGTQMLSITDAAFYMEAACDFGEGTWWFWICAVGEDCMCLLVLECVRGLPTARLFGWVRVLNFIS